MRILCNLLGGLAATVTLLYAMPSHAYVDQTGTITLNIPEGSNIVSVWLTGTTPTNECPSAGGRWTLQSDDALFKTKMAVLLTAASTGRPVTLRSTGTCGQWDSNVIYLIIATY
jgi:hypothetical protein